MDTCSFGRDLGEHSGFRFLGHRYREGHPELHGGSSLLVSALPIFSESLSLVGARIAIDFVFLWLANGNSGRDATKMNATTHLWMKKMQHDPG